MKSLIFEFDLDEIENFKKFWGVTTSSKIHEIYTVCSKNNFKIFGGKRSPSVPI